MFVETLRHELLKRDVLRADAVDWPATENSRPVLESELQGMSGQCQLCQMVTHGLMTHVR